MDRYWFGSGDDGYMAGGRLYLYFEVYSSYLTLNTSGGRFYTVSELRIRAAMDWRQNSRHYVALSFDTLRFRRVDTPKTRQ